VRGASAGLSYERQPYVLSADAMYSSGLSTGFADTQTLPQVVQINAGAQRAVSIPGLRPLSLRLSVLNVLDRVNEIRSAEGIGIFQAAYGPRRTVYGAVSMRRTPARSPHRHPGWSMLEAGLRLGAAARASMVG
jgi:hypothetical protein